MGTTADGGKGSKGRAANGDRPIGAASCRPTHTNPARPPQADLKATFGTGLVCAVQCGKAKQ